MTDEHDGRKLRCRRLGHEITFHYCRTQEGDSVCSSILDCWWQVFDVAGFLREEIGPERVRKLQDHRPPAKAASLIELIQRARAAHGINESDGRVEP
jgi:hypothetical protein